MCRIRALFVVGLLASGCGGTGDSGAEGAGADSLADSSAGDSAAAGSIAGDSAAAGDTAADPFAGFALEADPGISAAPRRLSLLLRNDASTTAIVRADGGVEEVLLDSVPAESRHRVDLLTRARVVTLRAETPEGRRLRTAEVAVGPDTVVEVLVGAAAGP